MRASALFSCFVLTGCNGCNASTNDQGDAAVASAAVDASSDAGLVSESRSNPIAAEAVAKVLNPNKLPPYQGPTAILEGTVYVRGPASPQLDAPKRSNCKNVADYRLFREGPADESGRRTLADAVVGVTGYDSFVPPKTDSQRLSVRDCAFDHRTVVLTYGQRLDVFNAEPLSSGVFYAPRLIKDTTSSLMIAAPGNTVKLYFQKPGRDLLVDGMNNSHLYADVFAAVNSLHVVTDSGGHFILPGIPVGELDVSVMHPAFDDSGVARQKLVFKAGQTTHHDFEVTYVPKAAKADGGAPSAADAGAKPHDAGAKP